MEVLNNHRIRALAIAIVVLVVNISYLHQKPVVSAQVPDEPAITFTKTSSGFYYPTGHPDSEYVKYGGTWLGRDAAHDWDGPPEYSQGYYHIGLDIAAAYGSPVYAIAAGVVIYTGTGGWNNDGTTNNVVNIIKHKRVDGTEFVALYGHIHSTLKVGDMVSGGVQFATVGNWEGLDHLHFGIHPGPSIPFTNVSQGIGFGRMSNDHWPDNVTASQVLSNPGAYPAITNGFVDPIAFIKDTSADHGPICQNGSSERYRPGGRIPFHPSGSIVKVRQKSVDFPHPESIWALQGKQRFLIPNRDRLNQLYGFGRGFDWRDVITVSPIELKQYSDGGILSGPLNDNGKSEPTGRLIRAWGGGEVSIITLYNNQTGVRMPFSSGSNFLNLGYAECNVAGSSDYSTGYYVMNGGVNVENMNPPVFTVASEYEPIFSTSAAAYPNIPTVGQLVSINTTVLNSNSGNILAGTANDRIVDIEVFDAANTRVFQYFFENQFLTRDVPETYQVQWVPPSNGTYRVRVAVFKADWTAVDYSNDNALTVHVGDPPPSPTPSPSPGFGGLGTIATGLSNPTDIATDGNEVFWTDWGSSSVKKVSVNGGTVTTLFSGIYNIGALAIDSNYVYFGHGSEVKRVPKGGGTAITLTSSSGAGHLVVDSSDVYWTNYGEGAIKKMSVNGGMVTTIASGSNSPSGITLADNKVYWTEQTNPGSIKYVGIGGGSVGTLASDSNTPGISTDGTNIYWTENVWVNGGKVSKVSIYGGTPTALAAGLDRPYDVVVDASNAYWVEGDLNGAVKQVSLNGGTITTLASNLNSPVAIAADNTNVYWIERNDGGSGTGTLKKATKGSGTGSTSISISQTSLNFGNVGLGQVNDFTLTITNQSSSSGTLTGNVPAIVAPFSVISGGGPFALIPGQSKQVTARFLPTAVGGYSGTLSITHNATNQSSPINISMSGAGYEVNTNGVWQATNTISLSGSEYARHIAISGSRAYITRSGASMTVVDLNTGAEVGQVMFSAYPSSSPGYVAIYGNRAYVALSNLGSNGQLAVVDTSTLNVLSYIPVGVDPWGVAVYSNRVYVTNNVWWSNGDPATVRVVDLNTNSVVATIPVGINPIGIAIEPLSGKAYVTNTNSLSKSVSIIDTTTNSVTKTTSMPNEPKGVAILGSRAYVSNGVNYPSGSVEVLDTSTDLDVASIGTGRDSVGVAADAGYVFVANQSSNSVSVIDASTNGVSATLSVGDSPTGIAVDNVTHSVYVVNQTYHTVTVLKKLNPLPPTTTTTAAGWLTSTSGNCEGYINPNGSSTNVWFEWGTSSNLSTFNTTGLQSIGSGGAGVVVAADLNGLEQNSVYYVRVAGSNSAGTSKGTILSFTTPPAPQTRTLTVASSNPSSGVSISVSPNDNSNNGNGDTQFTRTYNNNTSLNLTAPATAGGNTFQKWQRDGADWSTSQATSVTMDANHTMMAVYATTIGLRAACVLRGDFDGDGKADIAVWRPSTGVWYINNSTGSQRIQSWGTNGDVPVPADYDGDGKTDLAIYRPSTGEWYSSNSSNGSTRIQSWGLSDDVPVPGDYDGDGKADIAVWRPSSGLWFILNSTNGSGNVQGWGTAGDVPVPGDYDGDNKSDIAVWRPSSGQWFIINSSNGSQRIQGWGTAGDLPVGGDYDGDGKADIAVFRPSTGVWYIVNSLNNSQRIQGWGTSGDIPVASDYDGDVKRDIAVWRPSTGTWYIINSLNNSQRIQGWGMLGDVPVSGALIIR